MSGDKSEAKRLASEFEAVQSLMASLQNEKNAFEEEAKHLKQALKNEKEAHRDLLKNHVRLKEKHEASVYDHKRKESEWSAETKTKLEGIKHDIKV